MTEEQNANAKALSYLREVIDNDEKFNNLNNGEPIDITGSEGGKYILYPNGHVVRLDKSSPKLGKLLENSIMPYPDVLATVYTWIMHDEKRFLKNWGCGNIHVTNPNANVATENLDEETRHDLIHPIAQRTPEEESWFSRNGILIFPIMMSVVVIVPVLLLFIGIFAGNNSSLFFPSPSPSPTSTSTITLTENTPLMAYLLILLAICIFVPIIAFAFRMASAFRD